MLSPLPEANKLKLAYAKSFMTACLKMLWNKSRIWPT